MPLPTVDEPWKRIAIDIVGPLKRTDKGNRYLLTVMDFATPFPEAIPLRRIDTVTVYARNCWYFSPGMVYRKSYCLTGEETSLPN